MKKDKDPKDYEETLSKLVELTKDFTEDDWADIMKIMTGDINPAEIINKRFYTYDRPDYQKFCTGMIQWLGPFWNAREDDDMHALCRFVDSDFKKLSAQQKEDDMREYLYTLFRLFDPTRTYLPVKLFGPLWLMEKYKMTQCLDLVLEILRQDAYFYYCFFWERQELMSAALYQIGSGQLEQLEEFLYEDNLIPQVKNVVFDTIVMTAIRQPQKRLEIVGIITQYLKHCQSLLKEDGILYKTMSEITRSLATAHITEAMPLVKSIYEELDDENILYELSEVEDTMFDEKAEFVCPYESLDECMDHWLYKEEDEMDDDAMEPYEDDDEYDDDDMDRYDGIYNLDLNAKRLTVTVRLMDAPEEVMRKIDVPSNIYLSDLAEVIMHSFGRSDIPENYEFTDRDKYRYTPYLDAYFNKKEYTMMYDAYDCTLSEILKKKGDIASFDILKNKRPYWHHTLVLEKTGRYTQKTVQYINLIDGRGAYPPKSVNNTDKYRKRFAQGNLPQPDFKKIKMELQEYDEINGAPMELE